MLDAFVLHLTRASARRANAEALLAACEATERFEQTTIWPAVDGAALEEEERARVAGRLHFKPHYPFPLKPGEIGCFLSHRAIWAELQTRDAEAALILEDDAGLSEPDFADALQLAAERVAELGLIQLQTRRSIGPGQQIAQRGRCQLSVPIRAGLRTTAQMVSKAAAAHLLSLTETFDRPVDTFLQSHWHTGLRPATIHPSGVADIADQLDGTTIQSGKKNMWEKVAREVGRNRYRRAVNILSAHSTAPPRGGLPRG